MSLRRPFSQDPAHPFQLVKFLSWSSLVLILACSLFLVVFIGNYAKRTILKKDQEFARLLSENLNHQIYQRFTLPTVLGFGRVELKKKAQYERLDQVVQSTIHSFKVLQVRIFDLQGRISYSMDEELIGREDLAGRAFSQAKEAGELDFQVIKQSGSSWWRFFDFNLQSESYVLKTTFPLRTERDLLPRHRGPIIGILQFTQDITSDFETIAYFQGLIAQVVLVSSLILFLLLYVFILRADRILAERIQEKERLERKLHQNEKLASMGRMLASIAHEIRNPLGIIQSSAEILFRKARASDKTESKLSRAIFEEAQRLSRTVNDFLDYARPKQPSFQEVDLVSIIRQCLTFIETELQKKGIEVDVNLPDQVRLQGDKDLLYRALYNLLSNACQAIDGSGKITISWNEEQRRLEVRDSGPGFDPELQDKYLEPFYTTKDAGTGLGLAIVHTILSSHQAGLELGSGENGGGLVRISFPSPSATAR